LAADDEGLEHAVICPASTRLVNRRGSSTEKARLKCRARIKRLAEFGHELRRPEADYLRDGIYELRVALQGRNYRMLYFFHGQVAAVVSHGLVKERAVPTDTAGSATTRRSGIDGLQQNVTHICDG
jgi:putative component of toxin-antitoxin plasmid stabilization module